MPRALAIETQSPLTEWRTPAWVVERLLDIHPPPTVWVYEPQAGTGGIVEPLVRRRHRVAANDIRPECVPELRAAGAEVVTVRDFLRTHPSDIVPPGEPVSIMGNPPWSPGSSMTVQVAHALSFRLPYVAQHLPVPFLSGGNSRSEIWRRYGEPQGIYWFNERPIYVAGGGQYEPCWLVWDAAMKARREQQAACLGSSGGAA